MGFVNRSPRRQGNARKNPRLEVQQLEDRCTPATIATANQAFIANAYQSLLNRPVDAGGLAAWTSFMNQGGSKQQVILGIESSLAFKKVETQQLFSQLLHRNADAVGLNTYGTFLVSGGTYQGAAASLAGSTEYFIKQGGGSNAGFISALYRDFLHRNPDPQGAGTLAQGLALGMTRVQVASFMSGGYEWNKVLVNQTYQQYLNRPADTTGLSIYAAMMSNGLSYEGMIASLLSSAEFTAIARGTTTTVAASTTSPVVTQPVTFTATVKAKVDGMGTPTGTVSFFDNGTLRSTVALTAAGTAAFTSTTLTPGSHTITASYNGTDAFATSSGKATVTVAKASTTTTLTSNVPSPVFGQTITLSAKVTVNSPGSGNAFGNVTFKDTTTGATLGTSTIDARTGTATLAVSNLAVQNHSITASYAADAGGNFNASTSTPLAVTVSKAEVTVALTSNPNPSTSGQSVAFTAVVAAVAPGAGTPTGNVTFVDSTTSTTMGVVPLTNGQAVLNYSSLAVGDHTVVANYAGDNNFNPKTGSTDQHVT